MYIDLLFSPSVCKMSYQTSLSESHISPSGLHGISPHSLSTPPDHQYQHHDSHNLQIHRFPPTPRSPRLPPPPQTLTLTKLTGETASLPLQTAQIPSKGTSNQKSRATRVKRRTQRSQAPARMSSGPKRRGCDVCRKRHVKCDRQTPSCSQCIKAGWSCPGYASDFSFVNYSQEHPTGPSRGQSEDFLSASRSGGAGTSAQTLRPESAGGRLPLSRIRPKPSASSRSPSRGATPPASPAHSLREQFSKAVESDSIAASSESFAHNVHLRYFVPLIGTHHAVDNAVRLVSLASNLPPSERDVTRTSDSALINAHSTAIASLRKSVADPQDVKSIGTLAAAMLLHMYEQYCDPDSTARTFHAHGYASLIQLRGPKAFQTAIDRAILEAATPNIVFVALRDGEECFLAEPGWRDVFMEMAELAPEGNGRMTAAQLKSMYAACCIPGSLAAFHEWIDHQAVLAGGERTRASLSPPPLSRSAPDNPSLPEYLAARRRYLRELWVEHLPLPEVDVQGPWRANYDLRVHVGLSMQLGTIDYMLATVAPELAMLEPDLRSSGQQRDRSQVDLGPRPYDLPSDLIAECRHLAGIVRKYVDSDPHHPVLSMRPGRLSFRYAWEKTKSHQYCIISDTSSAIAEFFDWALAPAVEETILEF